MGTFGGIVILILILVAIFADVLAPYRYDKNAPGRPAAGPISPVFAGNRPVGARFLEPPDRWGSSFHLCRSGRDHG